MSTHLPHDPRIDVDDVIESLGFGWFQWKLLFICGLGWAADGMEMIAISFLLLELRESWDLNDSELGVLGASTFFGMLVGAYVWGTLSDKIGRSFAFQATVLIVSLSGMLTAFAPSVEVLIVLRLILGFGLGGNLPVDFAMFMEFMPVSKRGFFSTLLSIAWSVGEIFSCIIALIFLDSYGWRYYLFFNSLLGLIIFFFRRNIPESPRYLIVVNDHQGAWESLAKVAHDNKRELPPRDQVRIPPSEKPLGVRHLLSPQLLRATLLLWVIWFAGSVNLYGLFLFVPTYFSMRGEKNSGIITDTLLSSLVEVPGIVFTALVIDKLGRKQTLALFAFLAGCATLLFGVMTDPSSMLAMLMIAKFFIYAASAAVYTFTPEVYPTSLRTSGMGLASVFTRLAGILTPLVGERIVHTNPFASIVIWAIAAFVQAFAAFLLPFDTMLRKLPDTLAEDPRTPPKLTPVPSNASVTDGENESERLLGGAQ